MFEAVGLAGLLSTLQPRVEVPLVLPDLAAVRLDGWDAGYSAGMEAGTAAQAAALEPLRAGLAAAVAALDAACRIDADRLRPLFAALVEHVAGAVLMAELGAGAAVLMPLVEAALSHVRVGEAAVLRAHPDMLAMLQAHLGDVVVAADAGLGADEIVVATPVFVIDAGLSARLAAVVAGLA